MIRALAYPAALFAASSALAVDVRPAGEAEIAAAVLGCWEQEKTAEQIEAGRRGDRSARTACFTADGKVETISWFFPGGKSGEGLGASGTFAVQGGKLVVEAELADGWIFGHEHVACDVLMQKGVAMRLQGCIGSGANWDQGSQEPHPIKNMSFAYTPETAQ